MSGFQLSTQSAQRIVAEIGGIVGQNINMMDAQGYIIASTDPARIGFLHEGARQIIEERLPELYIRAEEATATARTGLNLPITHRGDIVGVIGITGEYGTGDRIWAGCQEDDRDFNQGEHGAGRQTP